MSTLLLPLVCSTSIVACLVVERYGFLLRVMAMGMGNEIDRERSIASYWARLLDESGMRDARRNDDD